MVKKRGSEFPKGGKSKGGKGKGNPSQRNARPDDKDKGICFNFSRGNGYFKFGDVCRFKHEGPKGGGGGGKRKVNPTLLAANANPKKKLKGNAAKSGRSIASMVMKDLKEMFKGDKEDEEDDKDDHTLFNLVRGESKKRVNFLVTLAEGGKEYVPVRASSMMIKAVEGKKDYKPRKSLIETLGGGSSSKDEDKPPANTHLGSPKRGSPRSPSSSSSTSSSEDEKGEAKTPPERNVQQGERSSRSNKQASAKKIKKLSQQDKASPVIKEKRIFRTSSSMSSSAFSPPKESGEWGSEDPALKPKWGRIDANVSQQEQAV